MRNVVRIILIAAFAAAIVVQTSEAGIKKVAKRVNMISFYGGYSSPTGNYDGFGSDNWSLIVGLPEASPSVDGSDLYESTYHFGFDYGQLRNHRMLFSFGFRYTRAETKDSVIVVFPEAQETWLVKPTVAHLYELETNFNYFLTDPTATVFSPYFGIGGRAGLMNFPAEQVVNEPGIEYTDQNELKFTLAVNFGADLKLWEAPSGRSYFALSSVNSYDLLASDNRPRYLNIGGAFKYYFRP